MKTEIERLLLLKSELSPFSAVMTDDQSFPITSDRPDMSGETDVGLTKYPATSDLQSGYFFGQFCFFGRFKTEVGPTKYPATSDLQSGYFFVQFRFLVSQGENQPLTTYCSLKFLLVW